MNTGKTVFSQIMEFLPMYEFRKCVERYHGDYKVKSFSCMDQFLCMAFAQMTLSRKPARHRILLALHAKQTLSHGHSWTSFAQHLGRTPTINATGASTPTLPMILIHQATRTLSQRSTLASIWTIRFTRWIPQPSICASRYSLGRVFERTKERSNFIRFWIYAAASHHLSILPTEKSTMSTSWTCLSPKPDLFISWIADISTSKGFTPCIKPAFFVITSQVQSSNAAGFIRGRSTKSTGLRCDQTVVLTVINHSKIIRNNFVS